MLNRSIIRAYNKHRKHTDKSRICHAPFTSLNFEQNGNITACCFNRTDILGKYPQQSIRQTWDGPAAIFLRDKISSYDLGGGCKLCRILLESGNYSGTKAIHYDEYGHKSSINKIKNIFLKNRQDAILPKVFEFEISNTCNLECHMCSGYFSSTIRKNREHLPPINNPYDDAFVEQVAEFIPALTDLKFLGGEPFLIEIYYKIWDKIALINPGARVHITTNGTVLNQKVKDLLSKLNVGIVVSIDSLVPENFEQIRVGAKLDKVLDNFHYFKELTKHKGSYLGIACCAMSNNWKDLPAIVDFANKQEVSLHFNVVWNPGHLSLRYLDHDELEMIEQYLSAQTFKTSNSIHTRNLNAYHQLIQTVTHWKKERSHTRLNNMDTYDMVTMSHPECIGSIPEQYKNMAGVLVAHYIKEKPQLIGLLQSEVLPENLEDLPRGFVKSALFDIWRTKGDRKFLIDYFTLLPYLGTLFYGKDNLHQLQDKAQSILQYLLEKKDQQAVLSDLIDDIDRKSIANQVQLIQGNSQEQIIAHLEEAY